MIKRVSVGLFICMLVMTTATFAQQNQKSLSLDECIVDAMKNNLRVAVELINPSVADTVVTRSSEKFLPVLSFGYNKRETNTASYSWIDAADQVRSSYNDYSVYLNQMIPTGGIFSLSLNSYKNETNRSFQTINPRYGSTLTFDFTQPLLKNFGFKINRREIIIAKNNREISEHELHQALLETIYNVEEAYWILAYSIEDLKVKRQSLQLAQDLLEENKRKIEVGTLPPIEIFTAESEVANREADILQADRLVKNYQDRLKKILNLPILGEGDQIEIIPSDRPDFERKKITINEALATAMARCAMENMPMSEGLSPKTTSSADVVRGAGSLAVVYDQPESVQAHLRSFEPGLRRGGPFQDDRLGEGFALREVVGDDRHLHAPA